MINANLTNKERLILEQLRFTPLTWSEIDDSYQDKYGTKKNSSTHHTKSLQNKGFIVKINDKYEITDSGHAFFNDNYNKKLKEFKIDFSPFLLGAINREQRKIQNKEVFEKNMKEYNQPVFEFINELLSYPDVSEKFEKNSPLNKKKYHNADKNDHDKLADELAFEEAMFWEDYYEINRNLNTFNNKEEIQSLMINTPHFVVSSFIFGSFLNDLKTIFNFKKDFIFPFDKELNIFFSNHIFQIVNKCFLRNPYFINQLESIEDFNFEIKIKFNPESLKNLFGYQKKYRNLDPLKILKQKMIDKTKNNKLDKLAEDNKFYSEYAFENRKDIFQKSKNYFMKNSKPNEPVPYNKIYLLYIRNLFKMARAIKDDYDKIYDDNLIKLKIKDLKKKKTKLASEFNSTEKELRNYEKELKKNKNNNKKIKNRNYN